MALSVAAQIFKSLQFGKISASKVLHRLYRRRLAGITPRLIAQPLPHQCFNRLDAAELDIG